MPVDEVFVVAKSVVEQLLFASVHAGRLYEVELTTSKGTTDDSRPTFYAVVGALEFVTAGSAGGAPSPTPDPEPEAPSGE